MCEIMAQPDLLLYLLWRGRCDRGSSKEDFAVALLIVAISCICICMTMKLQALAASLLPVAADWRAVLVWSSVVTRKYVLFLSPVVNTTVLDIIKYGYKKTKCFIIVVGPYHGLLIRYPSV